MSLDFKNAFYQYPNVLLNRLGAVFFASLAYVIGVLVMDYLDPLA